MPATYAHYRFGKDVFRKLPKPVRQSVRREQRLFRIGLHGPDILFYYRPLKSNAVNEYGNKMHRRQGTDVFAELFERAEQCEEREREAVKVYLYGFLCHFALDKACHPLVEEWMGKTGASHYQVESELERALMLHDGYNPLVHRPADHIRRGRREAMVIRKVFPEFTSKQIQEALRSARFYNNFFVAPGRGKRMAVRGLLKLAGKEKLAGLMIPERPDRKCRESTKRLIALYRRAADEAAEMIVEMEQAFAAGVFEPDQKYAHTFEAE